MFRISYLVIPLIVAAVATIGTLAGGMPGTPAWYEAAVRPVGTPPSWVFGPVWTVLYAAIAAALIIVWAFIARDSRRRAILGIFALNLAVNGVWSYLFFGAQLLLAAALDAALIAGTAYVLVWLLWPRSRAAALLLLPYALWTTYATYLATGFYLLN